MGKIEYFQFTSWVSGKNRRSARYPAGPLAQGAVAVPRIYRKRLRLLSLLSLLPCPFGTGNGSLSYQRPFGRYSVRERPGLPYEILISTHLAAETQLLPDLSWRTTFSAETAFGRTNHPQTNFSPAERHLAGPNTNPSRRLGGTGKAGTAVPNPSRRPVLRQNIIWPDKPAARGPAAQQPASRSRPQTSRRRKGL